MIDKYHDRSSITPERLYEHIATNNVDMEEFHAILDMVENCLASSHPDTHLLLALVYDIAQKLPDQSRYAQYQSRYFDFDIKFGDKILDMGSGHIPFPLATHLADISLTDHTVGRAGMPFKQVAGRHVYECSVEKTPFADKEFDFVYCSHVLEHVQNPETACSELMRIGKRGYIECPTRGKDTFFHTAKASNHAWAVECLNGALVFTEYSEGEINGIECDILMQMICRPQNMREKALAALARIKAATLNTMLLWEDSFPYEVRRQKVWPAHIQGPKDIRDTQQCLAGGPPLRGTSFFPKLRWGINVFRSKLARYIEPGA